MIKRHELWRLEYRQRRYLEHATSEEIRLRFEDLMNNVADFDAQARFALKDPGVEGGWIILLTHVMEELALRGGRWPELRPDGHFNPRRYVSCQRAAELWKGKDLPSGTYLLKFGKLKYLRPFLNVGSLRVAPASYYRDPSLNFAVQDSELEFTEVLHGVKIHRPPNRDYSVPRDQWIEMPIIGDVKSTIRSAGDYYIACFSSSYEYRLYDDFEADGCLVIKDIVRFVDSLQFRMEEQLPGWDLLIGDVEYRDPYHPEPDMDIFFCKHFRYAYQREFRFVWQSPRPVESLPAIHLELGPLTEYCELLCL